MQTPVAYQQISRSANSFVRPFFAAALILMVVITYLSDAIYDTGDGITHYQISRWAWEHPDLLLHHWGKPFFTLLSSPFAQFGYKGIVLFNVLCHVTAAWITWRIADRMKLPFAFLAGPLVIFAPISWGVAQSGLTEPLFALMLVSGIYFITGGKNRIAALIISLLPMARTEGYLLAPLFALFFLIRRDYVSLCLLGAGSLLYSVLGGLFVHHDFLWILHQNPYKGEEMYGRGGLFHFAGQSEFLFGWAMTAMIGLGLCGLLFRKRFVPPHSLAEIILVAGCFVLFCLLHSIFWWKGLFGSYGLIRVIACVLPCAVIVSLRGIQFTTRFYSTSFVAVLLTVIAVAGFTIFNTMNQHGLVLRPDEKQVTAKKIADAIVAEHLDNHVIYYGHPLIPFYLGKDPYDQKTVFEMWGMRNAVALLPQSIVVWDSHFGPTQYDLTEEQLLANPLLQEVIRIDDRVDKSGSGNGRLWIVCSAD